MSTNSDWTEERVRQLLLRAQPYAENGAILGARLGALLRRLDAEFRGSVLGDQNLKSLLTRFPDLGGIQTYDKSLDFTFQFGGSTTVPIRMPRSAARAALNSDLWFALVADRPKDVRYVDLHTLEIVTVPVGSADSPTAQEPERFLRIPPIPQIDLRAQAKKFAEGKCDETTRKQLMPLIEGDGWFRAFTGGLSDPQLRSAWLSQHREFVVSAAISWLNSHNIDSRRFLRQREKAAITRTKETPHRPQAIDRAAIRQLVLNAVSRMSEEELLNLPIPLRYLV